LAAQGEVALRFGLAHSLLVPFLAALVEVALQFGLAHSFLVPFFAVLGEMALLFGSLVFSAFSTVSLGPWFHVSPFADEWRCAI
jgi:hypothetical protein